MKKISIIISIILGLMALTGGIYFAWKKSQEILIPPISPAIQFPIVPIAPEPLIPDLKIVSDQPIFDYFILYSFDKNESPTFIKIFYITQSGKIFKVTEDAENELISSQIKNNLQQVKSSNNGENILIKHGDLNMPQFTIFNTIEKTWELLPRGITAADFSPDNKKIAYLKSNGNKSDLIIKNIGEAKTTKIISLFQKDFDLKWLTAKKILLLPKPSFLINADIWAINIKNKTLNKAASGKGLMINWSPDGSMGIKFSVDERRNPHLDLIDSNKRILASFVFLAQTDHGEQVQAGLRHILTLPNKCSFNLNSTKIYCAVPQAYNSIERPNLPDDYLKRAVYFDDFIYEIDIMQNTFKAIHNDPKLIIDAFNLSVHNTQLFFINRYDDMLYKLRISH